MRFVSATVLIGTLSFASLASAADGKGGEKGAPAPGAAGASASTSSEGASGQVTRTDENQGQQDEGSEGLANNPDRIDPFAKAYKPWEVGIAFETHRLIVQNDLAGGDPTSGSGGSGAGTDKMVNDYEAYIRYDITKHDRVSIRGYMYERFLADPGENGIRIDDMAFTYTHSITLPRKFNLDVGLLLTAPTSYESYLAGTITTPRLSVSVDRRFGALSLNARTYVQYDIQTEASYGDGAGGAPTSVFHTGVAADAELHLPFYEPLSIGVGAATGYSWYHNVAGQNPAAADSQFTSQPIQQSYGGEAYFRYLMPTLAGFKPDVQIAYGNIGESTIGYTNILHDGIGHLYLGYRENSEVYLRLAIAY